MRRPGSLPSLTVLVGLVVLVGAVAPSFSPGAIAGRPADVRALTLQTDTIQVDAVSKLNLACPGGGGSGPVSWTHTIGRGVHPILIAAVAGNASITGTTLSYGSQAMAFRGAKDNGFGDIAISLFVLVAPLEGTAQITTTQYAIVGAAISLFGVDPSAPIQTNTSGGATNAVQVNTNGLSHTDGVLLSFTIAQWAGGLPTVFPVNVAASSSQQREVFDQQTAPANCDSETLVIGSLPITGAQATRYQNWTAGLSKWAWRDFDLKPGQSDVCVNPDDPTCNGTGGTGTPPRAPPCTTFNCRLVESANASFVFLVHTVNLWVYIFLVLVVLAAVYVREQRKKNRKWPR